MIGIVYQLNCCTVQCHLIVSTLSRIFAYPKPKALKNWNCLRFYNNNFIFYHSRVTCVSSCIHIPWLISLTKCFLKTSRTLIEILIIIITRQMWQNWIYFLQIYGLQICNLRISWTLFVAHWTKIQLKWIGILFVGLETTNVVEFYEIVQPIVQTLQ